VFVEKRECTSASALSTRSSSRFWKEAAQLLGGEHALVDERPRRQRGEVALPNLVLDSLPHHERETIEVEIREIRSPGLRRSSKKQLFKTRRDLLCGDTRLVQLDRTTRQPRSCIPSSATIFAT